MGEWLRAALILMSYALRDLLLLVQVFGGGLTLVTSFLMMMARYQ